MDNQNNQNNHIVRVTWDGLVHDVMEALGRFMHDDAGINVALDHILTHWQVIGNDGAVLMSFATTPRLLRDSILHIINNITVEVEHDPEDTIQMDDITTDPEHHENYNPEDPEDPEDSEDSLNPEPSEDDEVNPETQTTPEPTQTPSETATQTPSEPPSEPPAKRLRRD